MDTNRGDIIVVLDNIRSAHNVGAIFRTCEGRGVQRIILGGYTPAPRDRFGREVVEIKKTSLGASQMVPWQSLGDVEVITELGKLQIEGYQIVAVEQAKNSVSLPNFLPTGKTVYIFGNEITGVSEDLLAKSDVIVEIPMAGQKESLNISVSVGIVLFYHL